MDLSPYGRARVYLITLLGVVSCVAVSLLVDWSNFHLLDGPAQQRAIATDIFLPAALAGPLLFLLTSKIRQLNVAHRKLANMAAIDGLTRLLNRAAFMVSVADQLSSKAGRHLDQGALLIVDIDHFKSINDRFGHQRGDSVLYSVAQVVRGSLRPSDVIGRVGGEEFAILLPGANAEIARSVSERIRSGVADWAFHVDGGRERITVSIGATTFYGIATYDKLFAEADRALYRAKACGRNQVHFLALADATATAA